MEPPEKKILLEKKFRDMKNKQEIQKKNCPKNTILGSQYL